MPACRVITPRQHPVHPIAVRRATRLALANATTARRQKEEQHGADQRRQAQQQMQPPFGSACRRLFLRERRSPRRHRNVRKRFIHGRGTPYENSQVFAAKSCRMAHRGCRRREDVLSKRHGGSSAPHARYGREPSRCRPRSPQSPRLAAAVPWKPLRPPRRHQPHHFAQKSVCSGSRAPYAQGSRHASAATH